MGLSFLRVQNRCLYLVLVFHDIFLRVMSVRLIGNILVGGDIHQLGIGPQTGICEVRRGRFEPWDLRGSEEGSRSIGCHPLDNDAPSGGAIDDYNQYYEDREVIEGRGATGECRRCCLWYSARFEEARRIGLQYRVLSLSVRAVQRAEVPLLAIDVLRWCVQVEWKYAMSCALHVFSKYWSWTSPAARRAGLTCQVEKEHVTRDLESFCCCES